MSKAVYIRSYEAVDIVNHMRYNKPLYSAYKGMIPYSLELIKLESLKDFKVFENRKYSKSSLYENKKLTNDIINVKFNLQYDKYYSNDLSFKIDKDKNTLRALKMDIASLKDQKKQFMIKNAKSEYEILMFRNKTKQIKNDMEKLNEEKKKLTDSIANDAGLLKQNINKYRIDLKQARHDLYDDGFHINKFDKDGNIIATTEYVVFQRTSAKSRVGEVLFIKKSIADEMISWSRMHLPFKQGQEVDYTGLLASESLVASNVEDTIHIPSDCILLIDDVQSIFKWDVDVVKKDQDELLICQSEDGHIIKNSLFDGESLISPEYINNNYGFILLRQHMFKSAAFACDIQKFLREYADINNIDFDSWMIPDMFGDLLSANKIKFVFTPSSLKALKFSNTLGSKQEMYLYWKNIVADEDCCFGICKHEKPSKRGYDDDNNILNQTSYQYLNSINFTYDEVEKISEYEKNYILSLKNDDTAFKNYLIETDNMTNENQMFIDLLEWNSDFANCDVFKNFRKTKINTYKTHCQQGHIRLNGDYCVLAGNLLSLLYHVAGAFDVQHPPKGELSHNQIYTTLHNYDNDFACFRSPHTASSNCYIAHNVHATEYDKYFRMTNNIVFANSIGYPLPDIFSGSDWDSDSCLILDNATMVSAIKRMLGSGPYRIFVNDIQTENNVYHLTNDDMASIDYQLAESKNNIGLVVNYGQLYNSLFFDKLNSEGKFDQIIYSKIGIATILSGIAIDSAKRNYGVKIAEEIKRLKNGFPNNMPKPVFFEYVGKQKRKLKNKREYQTTMDYLHTVFDHLKIADKRKEKCSIDSLIDKSIDISNSDRKQRMKIIDGENGVKDTVIKINHLLCILQNTKNENDQFKIRSEIEDQYLKFAERCKNLTIKQETMAEMISKIIMRRDKDVMKMLNILYNAKVDKRIFLNCFTKNSTKK